QAAETFPDDVVELQGYLSATSHVAGVNAYPGLGTDVPLYILGSSLFGARLAALLGLPYSFASHFAPARLRDAVTTYRAEFRPSEQLHEPYVIAGANVIATDDRAEAEQQLHEVKRSRIALILRPGTEYTDEQADALLASPQGQHIHQMMTYTALGTGQDAADYLTDFATEADADEVIVDHQG